MGFLSSLFQRSEPPASAKPGGRASAADTADAVQRARTRARQRLIGAVLLLGVGIIGFPLLFETQPRPIPVDIPIEIPRKDGLPPLALPAPRPADTAASKPPAKAPPAVLTETPTEAGKDVTAAAPASAPAAVTPSVPAATVPPAAAAGTEAARAKALLEGAAAPPAAAADKGRFVVQVGAFADAAVAREARTKVEKLGLKTYTQVVQTSGGARTRVRVGPFDSRDEASKAAARIKSAGLPSAVLTL